LSESSGAGELLNVGSRNKLMARDFLDYRNFHTHITFVSEKP